MRLADLKPRFLARKDSTTRAHIDSLADAQAVLFLCPKCYTTNGGPEGTHSVLCWFAGRGVPDTEQPFPRWVVSGSGLADLTLSPSVLLIGGCGWHGFVTNGEVTSC